MPPPAEAAPPLRKLPVLAGCKASLRAELQREQQKSFGAGAWLPLGFELWRSPGISMGVWLPGSKQVGSQAPSSSSTASQKRSPQIKQPCQQDAKLLSRPDC